MAAMAISDRSIRVMLRTLSLASLFLLSPFFLPRLARCAIACNLPAQMNGGRREKILIND
jgi:hypothetical protein